MNHLIIFTLVIHLLTSSACTTDDLFCIDGIAATAVAKSAEQILKLPNGEVYEGAGALPFEVALGKYSGQMSSIVLSQTPTEEGMDVTLVHFFDDGAGNTFWTSDEAVMIPTSDPSGAIMDVDDTMTVVGGTGDFECANGVLKNVGTINFITFEIEVNLTGQVCGGC